MTENGEQGTEQVEAKPKAVRRTSVMVIGVWDQTGNTFGALAPEFQPTGKAARKLDDLRRWLNSPAVAEKLGFLNGATVTAVRKQLVEATYVPTTTVKAKVR